jgi:S1-C subfamily serine protease
VKQIMAWRVLVVALVAMLQATGLSAQPTGNVLMRVFHLRFGATTGTAFLLDYENKQYFITARHIMASAGQKANIELLGPRYSTWKTFGVTVLKGRNDCVDVAVLIPTEAKLSDAEPIPYPYTFAFGQEAYFLGFPYGLYTSFGDGGGMAVALIKHAYISAKISCAALIQGGDKDETLILLDGLNNPGFSGGPVVAPDMFSPFTNIRAQKLVGVITGFRNESIPVQVGGRAVANVSVATNSGIIIAVPIERAIELIKDYVTQHK